MKIAVLVFLTVSLSAHADWTSMKPQDFRLAAPPAAGSLEEKKDHDTLLDEQKRRDYGACVLGNYHTLPTFGLLFGPGAGVVSADILTFEEYYSVRTVMKKVFKLTTNLAYAFKNHFKRPRPYQIVKDLQPCLVKPGYDESYPSGHAALGAIGGCLLAQRFPDKAYYLEQQGRIVGDLRVIGGVHNPSDVVAGQSLARQICDRLLSNPAFRRDFGLTR